MRGWAWPGGQGVGGEQAKTRRAWPPIAAAMLKSVSGEREAMLKSPEGIFALREVLTLTKPVL
jgi:hypothetical protein